MILSTTVSCIQYVRNPMIKSILMTVYRNSRAESCLYVVVTSIIKNTEDHALRNITFCNKIRRMIDSIIQQ